MKITKEKLLAQGRQAAEDRNILDDARLEEMEIMPTLRILGSLRFLQDLCRDENISIQDVTPELIIDTLKQQPKFCFD